MANFLEQAFSVDNLRRAWRWIRTNPDAIFKHYFRDIYEAYAVADEANIEQLGDKLRDQYYAAGRACKLYFPKKSGILRPYTLLSIEDQITYQALVNVIAEKLAPRVRHRYNEQVFGHLYAGKTSQFFYLRWQAGYSAFADAIRTAHADGFVHTATFDLAAFYDSIDHCVLQSFLEQLELDSEFAKFLIVDCLREWTATDPTERLYQGHGIPQGPLPSGLLAEVVLAHFDETTRAVKSVRYLRYVDDIKLFGRDEHELRHLLVELDLLSKSIGLFPQDSKIDIHPVTDLEQEIKSVSHPPEPGTGKVSPKQTAVRKRLNELTWWYRVEDETRFKWVLSQATPSRPLSRRLLRILPSYPHLYLSICRYFKHHKVLHEDIARGILEVLEHEDVYAAICAALLRATIDRVPEVLVPEYVEYARQHYKTRDKLPGGAELRAACAAWLLHTRQMTYQRTRSVLTQSTEWWVQKELVKYVDREYIGDPSYAELLNCLVKDPSPDVSLVAAYRLATGDVELSSPRKGINKLAQLTLKEFGVISRVPALPCGIDAALTSIFGRSPCDRSWRTIFGGRYDHAMKIAVRAKGYAKTDATAWVNMMDTFHDLLLDALYEHDTSLGSKQPGRVGGVLNLSGRLAKKYPALHAVVTEIHEKRLESDLSHAQNKRTGRRTEKIKFHYLRKVKPRLIRGYRELGKRW